MRGRLIAVLNSAAVFGLFLFCADNVVFLDDVETRGDETFSCAIAPTNPSVGVCFLLFCCRRPSMNVLPVAGPYMALRVVGLLHTYVEEFVYCCTGSKCYAAAAHHITEY